MLKSPLLMLFGVVGAAESGAGWDGGWGGTGVGQWERLASNWLLRNWPLRECRGGLRKDRVIHCLPDTRVRNSLWSCNHPENPRVRLAWTYERPVFMFPQHLSHLHCLVCALSEWQWTKPPAPIMVGCTPCALFYIHLALDSHEKRNVAPGGYVQIKIHASKIVVYLAGEVDVSTCRHADAK